MDTESKTIVLPRILEIGAGASKKLADVLEVLGAQKPLIISDRVMSELGYVEGLVERLRERDVPCEVFTDTVPEPHEDSLLPAVALVKEKQFDALVALGGGSVMDSAKAIALLASFGGQMRDYKFPHNVSQSGIPLIAIPTTAGTGSEVTQVTVITDQQSDEKMMCKGLGLLPEAALVDYEFTLSLPARVSADTGVDALVHAVEAYVSRKASAYTDAQALAAMRLMGPSLLKVHRNPGDRQARADMMLGATLAGIAFSNASVALVHGMSRPLGAHFHIPHGMSNAMLMPSVTAFSLPSAPVRYAQCALALGVANAEHSEAEAGERLVNYLLELNRELEVPNLAGFGVERDHYNSVLELMAEQALASGSPAANPRVASKAEIVSLYEDLKAQSWDG